MSDRMHVRSSEQGLVRLFALDLDEATASGLSDRLERGDAAAVGEIRQMLGADHILPEQVELFPVSNLEGVGLSGYLEQGHAIPAAELADHRAMLDGLGGWLVLVPSRAFDNHEQTLAPRAPLRWIGTFAETPAAAATGPALRSDAARGHVPVADTGETRRSRHLTFGFLLVICLIALVIGLKLLSAGAGAP